MNQNEPFFHQLKQLRIAQDISLESISDITKIGIRFLEAIEEGNFDILPNTYMRLFLRSYCLEIGADPAETLETYETIREPASKTRPTRPTGEIGPTQGEAIHGFNEEEDSRSPAKFRRDVVSAAAIFIVLLLIIFFVRRVYREPAARSNVNTSTVGQSPQNEVAVSFPADLFSEGRFISQIIKRVSLNPPLRLNLVSEGTALIEIIRGNAVPSGISLTGGESHMWMVQEGLEIRTNAIELLSLNLNGLGIETGDINGPAIIRVAPSGEYQIRSYATP